MTTSLRATLFSNRMTPEAGSVSVAGKEELFGRRIALISMSVGAALAAAKIFVGVHAGSASVVSDGLEASGDVISSGFVYAGLWLASKPPDYEHPYGHGRYETLAGLAVGAMLLVTGVAILWHGLTSLDRKTSLETYALYPLIAGVFLKVILAAVKFRTGRRIASTALQADAWHDMTDLFSTSIAMVAVILTLADPIRFGMSDRAGGIAIGIIIIFLAAQVMHRVVGQLLDTMPEPGKMAEIRSLTLAVPGALGIEKCFARRTGLKYHVDLHLEVDPDMTVRQSHEIAAQVRGSLKENLSWIADVLVHVEPSPGVTAARRGNSFSNRTYGK